MPNILKDFQKDYYRLIEERFSQILTERSDLRLFFINEEKCFTDGKNIIIDPALLSLYKNNTVQKKIEEYLGINNDISNDPMLALRMCARSPNIHECLHIIYSDFPPAQIEDERGSNAIRKKVLAIISNIIEDAFIEAAGCSEFDNLEHYLLWFRLGIGFIQEKDNQNIDENPLVSYLNHMTGLVLYPFIEQGNPYDEILPYIDSTKDLFFEGAICGDSEERYAFTLKIFDLIEPLIPEVDELEEDKKLEILLESLLERLLPGSQTHEGKTASIAKHNSKGKKAIITRRLFDEKGGIIGKDIEEKIESEIVLFLEDADGDDIFVFGGSTIYLASVDFDCSNLHKDIKIKINKPKINLTLKKAYQNIVNKYRLSINSFTTRFNQLLKGTVDEIEDRQHFGSGIMSKKLVDVKKRYWYKKVTSDYLPDIGFLFLIDGSGSMTGELQKGAIDSCIVLHEVLRANGIQHSIVEHRAIYGEPLLEHNVLVGFNSKKDEKYNLLGLNADHGTREGLTLYWAEKYLQNECKSENKMIIMISDGAPAHNYIDSTGKIKTYYPPVSIKDTALAVKGITRRGTEIIAIALSTPGENDCYGQLKVVYKDVVACTDIGKLTGQLLGVISKCLRRSYQ